MLMHMDSLATRVPCSRKIHSNMHAHVHAHVHCCACACARALCDAVHVHVCVAAWSPRLQPDRSSEVSDETATARAIGAAAAPRRVPVSARPPSSSCRARREAIWCMGLQA